MNRIDILESLYLAKTEQEWNCICNQVKEWTKTLPEHERSGDYPKWWFQDVIVGNLGANLHGPKR